VAGTRGYSTATIVQGHSQYVSTLACMCLGAAGTEIVINEAVHPCSHGGLEWGLVGALKVVGVTVRG